jgi:predicted PurR-regulated permease PerM
MKARSLPLLLYITLLILGLYFLFRGLIEAQSFLAPLTLAAVLAMVLLPVGRWLERRGIGRGWASLYADLLIILFVAALGSVLLFQIKSFSEDWPRIKGKLYGQVGQLQEIITEKTGISAEQQRQSVPILLNTSAADSTAKGSTAEPPQKPEPQADGAGGSKDSLVSTVSTFMLHFFDLAMAFLLVLVYIFFFLTYRNKFRRTLLKMVPDEKEKETEKILNSVLEVSQSYLLGRLILIFVLAVAYAIGLSITGIQYALIISVLAAVLSLMPFIGNIIGYALAVAMALFSGGDLTAVVGVSITFGLTQFIETYVLEPYVVGDKVHINPVFTIIIVVLGGAVWGIIGMLLAIPLLGMVKVVFDHVPVLKPLGYLFGQEDLKETTENKDTIFSRTKQWALKKLR